MSGTARLPKDSSLTRGSPAVSAFWMRVWELGLPPLRAAAKVGPTGHGIGVDVSAGMLTQAQAAIRKAGVTNIETLEADATDLSAFSTDIVRCGDLCRSTPLYACGAGPGRMAPRAETRRDHRIFHDACRLSQGRPALWRKCVRFGVRLVDPSAPLGTERAAANALERAGFVSVSIVAGRVAMSDNDFAAAWESNRVSAAHAQVRDLDPADLETMRREFESALSRSRKADPSFGVAEVFFAYGEKPLT